MWKEFNMKIPYAQNTEFKLSSLLVMSFVLLFDLSILSLTLIHLPFCLDLCKDPPLSTKWSPDSDIQGRP